MGSRAGSSGSRLRTEAELCTGRPGMGPARELAGLEAARPGLLGFGGARHRQKTEGHWPCERPLQHRPLASGLMALCRDIPRLEANYCLLLKTCRYFSIYLYGTLRRWKACVYFAFVLLILGGPWDDLYFLYKEDCTVVLEPGTR